MKRKQILNKIFGITMLALIGNSIIPKFIYGDEIKEAVVNDTKNYIISQQVEDKKIENTVDTDSKNNIQSENSNEYNIEDKDEEASKSVTNSEEINSSNEIVMTSIEAIGENAASKVMAENSNLKIAVLSDTHYFSPSMISHCPDFEKDKNSDRKLLEESSSILDSTLQSIKEDKPDVLIVSGDLTKDGEKKCHEEFAAKLENLKKELNGEGVDIKIYVINGNHDINNSDAKDFSSGKAVDAERTSPEDFKNIYKVSYDEADDVFTPSNGVQGGLSYSATPKEGFTVIAIDSGKYSSDATDSGLDEHETSGSISEELQDWVVSKIKSVIENAVNDILAMNVYKDENGKDDKNVYDLVNYVYLANLAGDETCTPWVKEVAENFKKKTLVNSLKDILVDTCTAIVNDNRYKLDFDGDKIITRGSGILSGTFKKAAVKAMGNNLGQAIETFNIDVKEKINDIFDKALTEDVKGGIGQLAYDVIISMTNDTSYVEDNNTCIK